MVKELKNYQSQVNAYKFEIERLDKQIQSVKDLYFNSRQNQNVGEDMDGDMGNGDMQNNYGSPNQMQDQMQSQPPPAASDGMKKLIQGDA